MKECDLFCGGGGKTYCGPSDVFSGGQNPVMLTMTGHARTRTRTKAYKDQDKDKD